MPVATEALPAAIVRPAVAPQPPGVVEHMYNLPASTAGQAKTKRRATATATAAAAPAVRPRMATKRQLFPRPPAPVFSSTSALTRAPAPFVFAHPGLTQAPAFFGTPALPQAQSHPSAPFFPANPLFPSPYAQTPFMFAVPSAVPPHAPTKKKTYNRTGEANNCRRCGEPRTAATGHSQFRGTIYCPSSESLTKEQWLEAMRNKKKM